MNDDLDLRRRDIDMRPRFMPGDKPLWAASLYVDRRYDPIYVKIGTGTLVVHAADLLDPMVEIVLLQLNMRPGIRDGLVQLHTAHNETTLPIACPKKISNVAEWVLIELPDLTRVVWEWEQVKELMRRRFVYLESQDEVLSGTDAERTLP